MRSRSITFNSIETKNQVLSSVIVIVLRDLHRYFQRRIYLSTFSVISIQSNRDERFVLIGTLLVPICYK